MLSEIRITTGALAVAGLLGTSSAVATTVSGCQNLVAAGLKTQVYYPGDAAYVAREASYWSIDAQLGPQCIVQPRTTAEVSTALKTLANTSGNFAVRSGGHSVWAGGSDIHNGVTIDLGLMNTSTYDPTTTIASIQPGPNWMDVYASLEAQGGVVAGGRDGGVGIGGFLTGGGNSYYTGRLGFGCDTVVNFEVVLADGCVVNANKNENSDLWQALKGGSGNFGIVTRFDLQGLPYQPVWGGMRASNRTYGDQIATSIVDFTNNNVNNPQDSFIVEYTYTPALFPEVVIAQLVVDTTNVANPPAFDEVQKIPTILTDLKSRDMYDISAAYLLPANNRNVWFTLTFLNDVRIINKAAALHDELVKELLAVFPADDFNTQCVFQPIPTYFATERSVPAGGNMLGLENVKQNAILWLGTVAVKTAAEEAIARPKVAAWSAAIEAYAASLGGDVPFRYLNYADPTQDPLKSYGATNDAFIKKVAAKYDPQAVFQTKVPGGFKISRA